METKQKKQTVDLSQLSEEELEKALKARKEKKRKEREKKKEEYEAKRDELVKRLVDDAMHIHTIMKEFKRDAIEELENFREVAREYGDIKRHSKGGFSLRHRESGAKVTYERNTKSEYDERADQAAELIREFLKDTVKKRYQEAYELISSLLAKNKAGDFNPSQIVKLIAMKDKFSDERWQKAIELFEECHNTILISMNVSFSQKNEMGKDINIPLTFASMDVKTEVHEKEEKEEKQKQ